jgi:hypothetical protein
LAEPTIPKMTIPTTNNTNKNIPAIYAVCGILVFLLSIAMAFSKEARDFLMLGPKNDTAA